jgi:hypothetical protein
MAGIARRLYDGWDHFARSLRPELFDAEPFAPDRYVFRGMSDANWRLVSSFDRQFPGDVDRGRQSSALLRGFRAASEEWLDGEILDDEDRLLALGQHHGLPTRLLDWSTSPYVAAFFALSGALTTRGPAERHVSVWALHLDAPVWTADLGVAFLPPGGGGNVRMRSQGGCFTRSLTPFASLEEYVEHTSYRGTALTQLSWPARDAARGLAELEMMGITTARLFPDFDGAARTALVRVQLAEDAGQAARTASRGLAAGPLQRALGAI